MTAAVVGEVRGSYILYLPVQKTQKVQKHDYRNDVHVQLSHQFLFRVPAEQHLVAAGPGSLGLGMGSCCGRCGDGFIFACFDIVQCRFGGSWCHLVVARRSWNGCRFSPSFGDGSCGPGREDSRSTWTGSGYPGVALRKRGVMKYL